jgi:four helix bundle protein
VAWQKALALVEAIYTVTRSFPKDEMFGLTSQMRRAAVSVPANIAEGAARGGSKEFVQFLNIAAASLSGLDTHLEIAMRIGLLKDGKLAAQVDEVAGILLGLISSVKRRT